MADRPKRRKMDNNPYTLKIENNIYYIIFKDISKNINKIKVSKEIYEVFDKFELDDLKELNEFDRHIEHSELTEITLNKRSMDKPISIEDTIIRNSSFEDLRNAINELPETQRRRIRKYYFDEKTEEEIAKEENTTQPSVHIILERAKQNLKKLLKNKI